ncbi:MAG TPA: 4a-hydroxytetrahydrobiopterin dehydratase [Candidatus Thermoplasmatota archaeon]|nr:4a-hydroxytetrahydrobiopterin dehydratase [Candidatus Thermoplasmatota archaeon]
MVQALSPKELASALARLPRWREEDGAIARDFTFKDFAAALAFVNRVGALAEEWEHHPDFEIHYNRVTLRLWTHSEEAITEWDTGLAEAIDRLPSPP